VSSGELPAGTVTFLFTDIEGSTQLLKLLGGEMYGHALDDHRRILREAFAEHEGHEIDTQGDSFFVAFRRAKDAVACAIACQRRLAEHEWHEGASCACGWVSIRAGRRWAASVTSAWGVHRAARICAAGHGGQVLVSQTTRELLRDDPIPEITLRDLGEHQLKDMDEPERIYQLLAPGLREEFPGLKTGAPRPFEGREGELAEAASEELAKRWRRPARRTLIAAAPRRVTSCRRTSPDIGPHVPRAARTASTLPAASFGARARAAPPSPSSCPDRSPTRRRTSRPFSTRSATALALGRSASTSTSPRSPTPERGRKPGSRVGSRAIRRLRTSYPQYSCAAFLPASPGCEHESVRLLRPVAGRQDERRHGGKGAGSRRGTTLWQEVERAILAEAPFVPAYTRSDINVVSKRVGNFQYNPHWGVLLSQLWVK
jgi:class 3 adenylate cyclase